VKSFSPALECDHLGVSSFNFLGVFHLVSPCIVSPPKSNKQEGTAIFPDELCSSTLILVIPQAMLSLV